jgi:hypothetical protein
VLWSSFIQTTGLRLAFTTLLAVPLLLPADEPIIPPALSRISPAGVERGTTADFKLEGRGLMAARRREIDVALVWRLDRWGRSVPDLLAAMQELEHLGVGFVSLTEAVDLTTLAGRAMAGLLAVFGDDAKYAIMQSHRAERALWPACQWRGTLHDPGSNSEAISASGALN